MSATSQRRQCELLVVVLDAVVQLPIRVFSDGRLGSCLRRNDGYILMQAIARISGHSALMLAQCGPNHDVIPILDWDPGHLNADVPHGVCVTLSKDSVSS